MVEAWRSDPAGYCPACKSAVPTGGGPCPACGWCLHVATHPDAGECPRCRRPALHPTAWREPAHLPRPAGMPPDEWGFRSNLFTVWATRPAVEFLSAVSLFADWLADRGDPEEHLARSELRPEPKGGKPKGQYLMYPDWSGESGSGWASPIRENGLGWDYPRPDRCAEFRAWPNRRSWSRPPDEHNGGWLLCWPPGFVRVTRAEGWTFAPGVGYRTRWHLTVRPGRALARSAPRDYRPLFGTYES